MTIFLAILMVLGIFIVLPTIIGFFLVAIYSGLFRVIYDRLQKRMAAFRRERVRVVRELLPSAKKPMLRRVT